MVSKQGFCMSNKLLVGYISGEVQQYQYAIAICNEGDWAVNSLPLHWVSALLSAQWGIKFANRKFARCKIRYGAASNPRFFCFSVCWMQTCCNDSIFICTLLWCTKALPREHHMACADITLARVR